MKKLVLIMTCAVIITVFIALNYLLWDKENNENEIKRYEEININNKQEINALTKENKNLDDYNKKLKLDIQEMDNEKSTLQSQVNQIEQENKKNMESLEYKDKIINKLIQQSDLKPQEDVVRKWADCLNKNQYDKAMEYMALNVENEAGFANITAFNDNYKKNIKSVRIKSIEPVIDETNSDGKADIILNVVLEAKKVENSEDEPLKEGLNERYFTIIYDSIKDDWLISNITGTL